MLHGTGPHLFLLILIILHQSVIMYSIFSLLFFLSFFAKVNVIIFRGLEVVGRGYEILPSLMSSCV